MNQTLKSYSKNIFCLESLWNTNIEQKLSVQPLLEITSKNSRIKYIHLSCNTKVEFEFNMEFLRRKESYQILYLAFHGSSESIHFADGSQMDLDELSNILGDKFTNLIIHFSTCSTLKAADKQLRNFINKTSIRWLSGYKNQVKWSESAALDILYFDALQNYKSAKYLRDFLTKSYPDLIKKTGFSMFF